MLALLAVFIHGQPVRVCVVDVFVAGVRVGSRNHVHAQLAAAVGDVAEGIHVSQPLAAVVQRDLGGIEGYTAACVQDCGIGVDPVEVVQPELHVVVAGIVLDKA